jgi:hypothetical protein
VLLASAVLVGLAIAAFFAMFSRDQENFRAAANPCERACLQDSGGPTSCREECASHPLTYGPASLQPSH